MAIPEVMKKTGISSPKASPSSLTSRLSCPSGSSRRRMMPAANAPSTASRSKRRGARAQRHEEEHDEPHLGLRRGVRCRSRIRCSSRDPSRLSRADADVHAAPPAPANAASTTKDVTGPRAPSSTAIATIGPELAVRAVVHQRCRRSGCRAGRRP